MTELLGLIKVRKVYSIEAPIMKFQRDVFKM